MYSMYFDCQCSSAEHTIRFVVDPDDNDIYLEVQLHKTNNIFKRMWLAFKYVCGYSCKYGHWDVTLLGEDDRKSIVKLLQQDMR